MVAPTSDAPSSAGLYGLPELPFDAADKSLFEAVAFGAQKVDPGQRPRQQGFGRQELSRRLKLEDFQDRASLTS
jgi:hypothetical protein